MPEVRPFRALRYDPGRAGPLDRLVAPPYDVISPSDREELRSRSPHNVVRLTLPDSEEAAAAALAEWRTNGVLVQDDEPAYWALEQEYVGTGRGEAHADSGSSSRSGSSPTTGASCRTSARIEGPRRGACGCSGRRARSWSRSSCSTAALR